MSDSDLKDKEETSADELENEYGDDFSDEEKSRIEDLNGQVAGNDDDNDDEGNEEPQDQPVETSPGLYRQEKGRKKLGGSKTAKKALMYGGPMVIVLILFVLFIIFIGSLKAIHFATVLRSTGFAASQLIIKQSFKDIAYTDWATENDTVELPKSKLLDRIRGRDMRKVQQTLADEGKFRYTKDAKGTIDGVEINGEKLKFDDLAKKMGADSYDKLGYRERLTAEKFLTDKIKVEVFDGYDGATRSFRNGFWKGFREATDIKMTFFHDIKRDKVGKGTVDEKYNSDESRLTSEYNDVQGTSGPKDSGIAEVDEGAKAVDKTISEGAKQGRRIQTKEALDSFLKTKGSDLKTFQEGVGDVSQAAFLATVYCIGHDLTHTGERINKQMELTMARFGHQQQTATDQIKSGDVTSGDAAFANKEWGGDANNPDAADSPLYQQAIGNEASNTGLDQAPRMNVSAPFIDWLKPVDEAVRTFFSGGLNHLPVVGDKIDQAIDAATTKGCGVIMNPAGQIGLLVADLGLTYVSGGLSKVALTTLKAIPLFVGFAGIGQLIQWYINQVAGAGISGTEVGASKYNASAISTDYLNSQTSRGVTYGSPESSDEASGTKVAAMAEMRNQYQSGGLKERYFAISNPTSLVGLAVAKIPTSGLSASSAIAALPSLFGSIFSKSFSIIGSIFSSPKVLAADSKSKDIALANDYFGVNQWGWTTHEQDVLRNTNTLDNATQVEQAIDKDPSYYSDLAKCYASDRLLSEISKDKKCSVSALRDNRALQWRIYKLHDFAANQMSSVGLNEN